MKFQIVYKISDTAIVILLRFFKYFILTIGKSFNIPVLQDIHTPLSIHGCHSLTGSTYMPFKEVVVCPTCHMLYDPQVHMIIEGNKSAKCTYVRYPHHTQMRFRTPCNTILMNTIKRGGRDTLVFRARKTYCYYGLKTALKHLLARPAFLSTCNSWKKRLMPGNKMGDFIDGKVWLEETKKT